MKRTSYKFRILIVDDRIEDAEVTARELKHLGHTFLIATTVKDALNLVDNEQNVINPIDMAIVDYWLEPGYPGTRLCKALKEIDPDMFILMYSADADPQLSDKILLSNVGSSGFFQKANDITELEVKINNLYNTFLQHPEKRMTTTQRKEYYEKRMKI